ncbi:uncharacterized protein LOC134879753 [Eleginops maclovinus]|uniref:uncharacterized protein LOC134879753 n=1 Tax=Eleginops maclovinus TaxID=56733 RepID=UPI00307FF07E
MNSEREQNGIVGKSVVNGPANGNVTNGNQMDPTDDKGLTRKKVVKVVRRVVRKVVPTEEDETAVPTKPSDIAPQAAKPAAEPVKAVPASVSKAPVMSAFSFKHDVIKTEEKDDISRGLTNLMVRGRTREPRPRISRDERPEKIGLEKQIEKKEEKVVEPEVIKEERKEDKTTLKPQEVDHKPTSSGPVTRDVKSPVAVNSPSKAISSKSTHSRPLSLPPIVGFIPAPKPSPMSPPPGFVPAPRSTSATKPVPPNPPSATKPSPTNPPSATKPSPANFHSATKPSPANPPSVTKPSPANPPSVTKSSPSNPLSATKPSPTNAPFATKPCPSNRPTTQVAQRPPSLSPPPRFTPAPKTSPVAAPFSKDPLRPHPGPLSPPQGLIPIQHTAVSQQEVHRPHFACLVNIVDIGVEIARPFELHVGD